MNTDTKEEEDVASVTHLLLLLLHVVPLCQHADEA